MRGRTPRLTYYVELPGGQNRLRQLILYVARRCEAAKRFGGIKLNKILWKSDFDSFAMRQIPVTGRRYQREKFGPVPREMLPLHREMHQKGLIKIELVDFGEDVVEHRTVALAMPDLELFTTDDLGFVNGAIQYYWNLTGMETSDDSHGVAWQTRANGDPMPYELAFLSDSILGPKQRLQTKRLMSERGWVSD